MAHTIAALFDQYPQAHHALEEIVAAGVARAQVHVHHEDVISSGDPRLRASLPNERGEDVPHGGNSLGVEFGSFFSHLFGNDAHDDAQLYAEAIHRGGYVLTVVINDDTQLSKMSDIVARHDPIEIQDRISQWTSSTQAAQVSTQNRSGPGLGSGIFQNRAGALAESTGRTAVKSDGPPPGVQVFRRVPNQGTGFMSDTERNRRHHAATYGHSGRPFEDYAPAYAYGLSLAAIHHFQGRDWDDIASDARTQWESRNPRSDWESVKGAVWHGWENVSD